MSVKGETTLTVIIATQNRREMLRRCLDSLRAQTADPSSFEAIVADDGSDDGTAEMAEAFEAPFELNVLRLRRGGQARAQNAALANASGDACLLLDDDVIASPSLVEAHAEAHRTDPKTVGVGAITQKPPPGPNWYAHAFARSWNTHYEEFEHRGATWIDCYGANLSAPRLVLQEVGGIDTDLSATFDLELGERLCRAGCTCVYLPDAHGVHDDRKPGKQMLADAERQGDSHLELSRRRPELTAELLDWSGRAGPKEVFLRRLLIALRVPPRLLARLGPLVPGEERELLWFSIVRRFAFWRGVRRAASRSEWKRLTG